MSNFHQIDPGKFVISLGTVPSPISGYAKGSFIEVDRDANAFEKFVGSDGEVTRVRNRNRAGGIKITLQQGSQANALLSALAAADELNGTGVVPITFMDMSGQTPQTTAAATFAWVRKLPKGSFNGESEEHREWFLDLSSMEFFIGGN
jgi:hypothetical protein